MTDRASSRTRASDHERDRVVRQLRRHNLSGRLSTDEFERRLEVALSAQTTAQLAAVADDLPALPAGAKPIRTGSVARVNRSGNRPFLIGLVAHGRREEIHATALRTIGRGLIGSGFELVSDTPEALEFTRVSRRGWFSKDRERVVISFAPHQSDETEMVIYGRARRKVRNGFADLAKPPANR